MSAVPEFGSLVDEIWSFLCERSTREPTGCWLWTGATIQGYGVLHIPGSGKNSRPEFCHRLSWSIQNGPIPEGMDIMHSCDVRACVNPRHLSAGTRAKNLADMRAKGRGAHKISDHQAAEIRELAKAGETGKAIAERFKIAECTVSAIISGKLHHDPTYLSPGDRRLTVFSPDEIETMRVRHVAGDSLRSIGRRFGCSHVTVRNLLKGRT